MKFIYRGVFSKGLDTEEQFGVTFKGREPSEVAEAPAINWMLAHPDYEPQADEVEAVAVVEDKPKPAKKARKAK
ncbi:hypothetical protein [Sphingopyxis sp.]|uniref:hypothetical protein n=1 Tax=Sphingopyxis sp. TaxID=1908224 RepID=UPI0025FE6EE1|nr:hypothetical protein [Sphingopyxis sp.]MBK6414099.1 hypothetical protein [Sphingopyxis sp.]